MKSGECKFGANCRLGHATEQQVNSFRHAEKLREAADQKRAAAAQANPAAAAAPADGDAEE